MTGAWSGRVRRSLHRAASLPVAGGARLLARTGRSTRFAGAYDTRDAALNAIAELGGQGYDDESIAEVSFDVMCGRAVWDYPVVFWLDRLLPESTGVVDAGGHMGTKYIAFSDLLNLSELEWTVLDMPGIIRAARKRQNEGMLPKAIRFEDRVDRVPAADVLLASGLLQYLNVPFADFVATLPARPRYILLNKVAVRSGPGFHTIERIGQGRVAYAIRNRAEWELSIDAMGYVVLDAWSIPELGHIIPTHPRLGQSESRGYVLQRRDIAVGS